MAHIRLRLLCVSMSLLFIVGCAVTIKLPANRLLSPESSGEFLKGHIDLRGYGAAEVETVSNRFSPTPSTDPDIREN